MDEDRLTELEIKVVYQEDLLQALNQVVSEQQKQITRLEEIGRVLNERIKDMAGLDNVNQGAEIPPHY